MRQQTTTEYPQVPFMLASKKKFQHNILIGSDPVQMQFAEEWLGVKVRVLAGVSDDILLGSEESLLIQVDTPRLLDISPNTRANTGVWSLAPLVKGCAGLNAIVKQAAVLLKLKPERAFVQQVANRVSEEEIESIMSAVWQAGALLLEGEQEPFKRWLSPWQSSSWMPANVDPQFRLNSLYRELCGYVFSRDDNDRDAARKFGITPKRFDELKKLRLDPSKVEASVEVLSAWRLKRTDPLVCALRIARIWATS